MLFMKSKDEKFCPLCLTWYNIRQQEADKHRTGNCKPITKEDLNRLEHKLDELLRRY